MDSQVTNIIQIGRIGFGTNAGGGSYTLENNAALSSAVMSNVSFTAANTNTSTMFLDGSNTGANRFDGASGNVAIVKNGAGRWDLSSVTTSGGFTLNSGTIGLSGNNAMGGGLITINSGTVGSVTSGRSVSNNIAIAGNLQLGGLGQSTTFSGNWDLGGGNRTITMGNSATMSGTITNGNLTIKDGTLNLSGAGLIANNTGFNLDGTNAAATLNVGAITASGLTVDNFSATTNTTISLTNKSLTIGGDNSSTTVRAAITGAGGSLIKNGTGTLTLGSSTSTYSGGTSLNGGAIAIASDNAFGAGAVSLANGTQLGSSSSGARTITNTVNVNGDITLGGLGNNTTLNGSVNLGSSDRKITLGNSGTIGGVISGVGGLILESSSPTRSLNLTNANNYTGPTTVNGGILRVNGALASSLVTVNSGATLGGSGVISNSVVINSGAFLAPGNSPGLLTINGSLTLDGEVVMELNGTTTRGADYDAVNVGGLLTYGGKLTLNLSGTYAEGSAFNLFDFSSTAGSFTTIDLTGSYVGSLVNNSGTWTGTVGGVDWQFTQNDGLFQAVPEPSTYALIGMAAAAFAGYSIRRRKRSGN